MSEPRVRVYLGCSLDGFIAGPDGNLDFLHAPGPDGAPPPSDQALRYEDFFGQIGAMLMGRATYDVVSAMDIEWPYGEVPVLVPTHRELHPVSAAVRRVQGDIAELIAAAKLAAGEGDVYLDGGDLVRQALDAGLVDELTLTVLPLLHGGEGVRLFTGLAGRTELVFTGHHTFDNGMVQITARPRYSRS